MLFQLKFELGLVVKKDDRPRDRDESQDSFTMPNAINTYKIADSKIKT